MTRCCISNGCKYALGRDRRILAAGNAVRLVVDSRTDLVRHLLLCGIGHWAASFFSVVGEDVAVGKSILISMLAPSSGYSVSCTRRPYSIVPSSSLQKPTDSVIGVGSSLPLIRSARNLASSSSKSKRRHFGGKHGNKGFSLERQEAACQLAPSLKAKVATSIRLIPSPRRALGPRHLTMNLASASCISPSLPVV